ncbi:uncharacterized protein TNCV_5020151 [Trichonephila clavipes]|nr:uncharacterized protein TNCV_5020151 [Trichonephila clavipes]
MNLLKRKDLIISEKESLPALTSGPSQKFSASSEPYEFVFFSEKLNFSQLNRLRFLEVFTVRFRPLPGRRPSLSSSLKRQIALDTVCRGTFSKRTVIFLSKTSLK